MSFTTTIVRRQTWALLGVMLALTLGGCASGDNIKTVKPPATFSPQQEAQLLKTVLDALEKGGIPGAVVGVWAPDQGTWVEAFGQADLAEHKSMTVDHKFRIGSITKTATAAIVLQLAGEGVIDLDQTIEKYDTTYDLKIPNAKEITIRQLLNHTSGLFSYTDDPALDAVSYANLLLYWTPQELIKYAVSHRDTTPPGKEYHYSNTGYALLGLIIEEETKHRLEEEMDRRIIKKLGLKNTSFPTLPNTTEPHANGYMSNADLLRLSFNLRGNKTAELVDVTAFNPSWAWAAGAMISNVNDLKAYAKAIGTGSLVGKKMQAEQLKMMPVVPGSDMKYGLGLAEYKGWLGHRGEVPGYDISMYYSPELDATFVVCLNRTPNSVQSDALLFGLAKIVYPKKF
ncbi:MAG: beta-lactamase family protein [Nitrospirota bacterium]|nr:beta-lactamase family protein [Nitrospirota bacterium]